jgi:hypothetical protein
MSSEIEKKEEQPICSLKFTNIKSDISLRNIFEECIFLKIGEIVEIVLSCYLSNKELETKKSVAYIYFKPANNDFIEKINQMTNPFPFVFFDNSEPWYVEKNTVTNHFRTDPYEQKRILIQSINSSKNGNDINFIFREHGDMEQVDFVWVQSNDYPLPTRVQTYLYFREWGDELFTYKLLEELNDVGVFTIKYDYNGERDLLWIYELCPQDENSDEFSFEFGKYRKWIPDDDPKYGSRKDKHNKLNWYFTKAGKFAYAERIVENELMKHGGLFIGPEKTFYKVEVTRRPVEFSWKANEVVEEEEDIDENELDLQEAQKMVMNAIQRCMNKNSKTSKKSSKNTIGETLSAVGETLTDVGDNIKFEIGEK